MEASGINQSGVSVIEGPDEKGGSVEELSPPEAQVGSWPWGIMVGLAFGVVGLLIIGASVLMAQAGEVQEDSPSSPKGGGGGGGGGGSTNSTQSSIHTAIDLNTQALGTTKSKGNGRPNGRPTTTTPMPQEPTRSPDDAPAMPKRKLLCTVNTKIEPETGLPDDGVCDLLFYDSLSKDDILNLPEILKEKLPPIVDYAKDAQLTELGMSLSAEDQKLHESLTSKFIEENFRVLWREKGYHFGMLNVHSSHANLETIKLCLASLKTIYKATTKYFRGFRSIYTVLGMAPHFPLQSAFTDALRESNPSLVIFLTHVSFDDRLHENCRMLPASVLQFPDNNTGSRFEYGVSILQVTSYLNDIRNQGIQLRAAISFTMRGHFYKASDGPKNTTPSFEPFLQCTDFFGIANVEPHLLCNDYNSSFGYDMDKRNVFAFNRTTKKMMMFDNDYSLTGKLCAAVTAHPQLRFGVAAYDIIYDQGLYTCPKFQLTSSPFGRVQTLGMVRELGEKLYASGDMQSCLKLFGEKAEWKAVSARSGTDGQSTGDGGGTSNPHRPKRVFRRPRLQPSSSRSRRRQALRYARH